MKNKTSADTTETKQKPIAEAVREDKARDLPAAVPVEGTLLRVAVDRCLPATGFNRTDLDLNDEFLASVKAHGVVQPALVRERAVGRGTYEIIAGHRRHAAALVAKLADWPVLVIEADDARVRELRLVENLQRADLTALDEARQYQAALASGDYGTGKAAVQALATRLQRGVTGIYDKLQLLKAGEAVQKAVSAGTLEFSTGVLLAKIGDAATQAEALATVLDGTETEDGPMSYRQAKEFIAQEYQVSLKGAPFDLKETYTGVIEGRKGKGCQLVDVGPCEGCPRREGERCLDVPCYAAKKDAHGGRQLEEAKRRGQTVLEGPAAKNLFSEWGRHDLRNGEYIDLAARCDELGWDYPKSWKATLGKHAPAAIVALDPGGKVRELLKAADATAALKAAGVKLPARTAGEARDESAERAKEKKINARVAAMRRAAAAAAPRVLDKLVGPGGAVAAKLWPLLARQVFEHTSIDAHAFAAKRRGLATTQTAAREALEKWLKGENDPRALAQFAVELLCLGGGAYGNAYCAPRYDDEVAACAKLAGVDLGKLEKEAKEPAKAATDETRTQHGPGGAARKPRPAAKKKAKVKK